MKFKRLPAVWPNSKKPWRTLCLLLIGLLSSVTALTAHAHLIAAQRGTLNIVGNGVFVVMSLPVSAFTGIDDDADGRLSPQEMQAHTRDIEAQVVQGLQLIDQQGARPLEALMLHLSPDDDAPLAPTTQLVVLGRFALAASASQTSLPPLQLKLTLYGKHAQAQQQSIMVTQGKATQNMILTPERPDQPLFPSGWRILLANAAAYGEQVLRSWSQVFR